MWSRSFEPGDAILSVAYVRIRRIRRRYGERACPTDGRAASRDFAGKLGGKELNYSSDID